MNWSKILFTLIIALIFVPLAFMGANVFFPDYTGDHSYYYGNDCYGKYPMAQPVVPPANATSKELVQERARFDQCLEDEKNEREGFEQDKRAYDAQKYIFITVLCLIALVAAIFIKLADSVMLGLFLGSTVSTFVATWIYFDTKSKIGFGVLVLIFIAAVYFINRHKGRFKE